MCVCVCVYRTDERLATNGIGKHSVSAPMCNRRSGPPGNVYRHYTI
jgi:hypothetical protein